MIGPQDALGLLELHVGRHHGTVLDPEIVPRVPADPAGLWHASVPRLVNGEYRSAGGGVGASRDEARAAAIGEALERYAASECRLETRFRSEIPNASDENATRALSFDDFTLHSPEQRRNPDYPEPELFEGEPPLNQCFRLIDNKPTWLPAALVGLTSTYGALATSSGLAADPSVTKALLRATQELVERDAFMSTWLHQLPGRAVPNTELPEIGDIGGTLVAFDITQQWSPHPVAAVLGTLPLRGIPRHSLGLACRSSWAEAAAKAAQECLQGIVFAGYEMTGNPKLHGMPISQVTGFDEHAVFYTANPDLWSQLPIFHSRPKGSVSKSPVPKDPVHRSPVPKDSLSKYQPTGHPKSSPSSELEHLTRTLADAGVDLFYRELSTIDLRQSGLRVVRVVAPKLTPIHHNHNFPFLGGTTPNRTWRYPDVEPIGSFPSPFPHPLG